MALPIFLPSPPSNLGHLWKNAEDCIFPTSAGAWVVADDKEDELAVRSVLEKGTVMVLNCHNVADDALEKLHAEVLLPWSEHLDNILFATQRKYGKISGLQYIHPRRPICNDDSMPEVEDSNWDIDDYLVPRAAHFDALLAVYKKSFQSDLRFMDKGSVEKEEEDADAEADADVVDVGSWKNRETRSSKGTQDHHCVCRRSYRHRRSLLKHVKKCGFAKAQNWTPAPAS